MSYLYLLLNILFLVIGQLLFKLGLDKIGGISLLTAWRAALQPYIVLGLFLYVIATLLWFIVLSRLPLSTAYPMQSLAYVLGLLVAWQIFNEPISIAKWVGVVIICIGVAIVSYN